MIDEFEGQSWPNLRYSTPQIFARRAVESHEKSEDSRPSGDLNPY
jgi:hypothetical protein